MYAAKFCTRCNGIMTVSSQLVPMSTVPCHLVPPTNLYLSHLVTNTSSYTYHTQGHYPNPHPWLRDVMMGTTWQAPIMTTVSQQLHCDMDIISATTILAVLSQCPSVSDKGNISDSIVIMTGCSHFATCFLVNYYMTSIEYIAFCWKNISVIPYKVAKMYMCITNATKLNHSTSAKKVDNLLEMPPHFTLLTTVIN